MLNSSATDFLESQCILSGIFITFVAPIFVLQYLKWKIEADFPDDPAKGIVNFEFPLAIF